MSRTTCWAWLAVIASTAAVLPAADPADLVLAGGRVVTLDTAQSEATSIAARDGRIVAVGTDQEIARFIGDDTRVIKLAGRLVLPGFIEGHGHFMGLGQRRLQLDLVRARSWTEIVAQVRQAVGKTPPGRWIVGRGWHQEHWDRRPDPQVEGYPTHDALSRVSPDHPVVLVHRTGHMLFANARAMKLAGINDQTPDPDGGRVLRDDRGRAIGVFRETAGSLIRLAQRRGMATLSATQLEANQLEAIKLATDECLANGITSFQDAGSSFADVDRFRRLIGTGSLRIRLWVMLNESNDRLRTLLPEYRTVDEGDGFLTVRAIKRMADGALGSHGAWLLEPYNDLPDSRGLVVTPIESIKETALLAIRHHMQLCVHAIGDRANREVLNLFRLVSRSFPRNKDLRWRIEHAQHLDPRDIPRFARLGVIASM